MDQVIVQMQKHQELYQKMKEKGEKLKMLEKCEKRVEEISESVKWKAIVSKLDQRKEGRKEMREGKFVPEMLQLSHYKIFIKSGHVRM